MALTLKQLALHGHPLKTQISGTKMTKTTQEIIESLLSILEIDERCRDLLLAECKAIRNACDRLIELERKAKDYELALLEIERDLNGQYIEQAGLKRRASQALSKHATTTGQGE